MKPVRLDETEAAAKAAAMSEHGWERKDGKWLEKKYRFSSFPQAISFVVRVGEEAEARVHHPLISIDYRMVTLRLTTWSAGGLTTLDFESAEAYDRLFKEEQGNKGN
ncbi:4a-hydroxytetrahydrobiopterin dehydratase [Paenibacillus thermotolerans]|uniref:4a-hydroxytetrahydrobiopterin dehydratase n=1 Tax=Paenibacillus thermotolerans TaxID=3027807 RepID=UPI002367738B|nr:MULTISPECIES: 4a-hydroxytetrahydrobiopterin dehydratase [unclassified Paenibacillus]